MSSQSKKNVPVVRSRKGRFQISVWKKKRLVAAKNDFDVEREVETVRACVQYSRFNRATNSWENQSIWCSPDELHDLANVLDELGEDNENSKNPGPDFDSDSGSGDAK